MNTSTRQRLNKPPIRSAKRRSLALATAGLTLSIIATACSSAHVSAGGVPGSSGGDSGTSSGTLTFDQLVANAKASNHVVSVQFPIVSSSQIDAYEAAFQKEFGFQVELKPVKTSAQVSTTQMVAQAPAKTSPIDMLVSVGTQMSGITKKGLLREPDWTALESKWPIIGTLRDSGYDVPIGSSGAPMSNYCLLAYDNVNGIIYNTKLVSSNDMEQMKSMLDQGNPVFAHKVAIESTFTQIAAVGILPPNAKQQDAVNLSKKIAANDPVLASGTTGVITAVETGQAGLGEATSGGALPVVSASNGNLGFKVVPLTPSSDKAQGNPSVTCLSQYNSSGDNPYMAELFMAWWVVKGIPALPQSDGTFRFDPQESSVFPGITGLFKGSGLTPADVVSANSAAKVAAEQKLGDQLSKILKGS